MKYAIIATALGWASTLVLLVLCYRVSWPAVTAVFIGFAITILIFDWFVKQENKGFSDEKKL